MASLPVPPVPDLARVEGATVEEAYAWFVAYYEREAVPWNYLRGTKCVRESYRGLHALPQLLAGCQLEKIEQGRKSNAEIVTLAAPLAFGRKTQVFDLPRRQFQFGRDLRAGYRIPFFFVEDGIMKLYYLQQRKGANLTYDQMCMVATIHKRFLLDTEFFGQPCEIEYVDLAANALTNERVVTRYALATLELWPEERLRDRLTLVSEAFERVRASGVIKAKRIARRPDKDMNLFD